MIDSVSARQICASRPKNVLRFTLMELLAKDVLVGRLNTKVDKMACGKLVNGIRGSPIQPFWRSHTFPSPASFLLAPKEAYDIG